MLAHGLPYRVGITEQTAKMAPIAVAPKMGHSILGYRQIVNVEIKTEGWIPAAANQGGGSTMENSPGAAPLRTNCMHRAQSSPIRLLRRQASGWVWETSSVVPLASGKSGGADRIPCSGSACPEGR